MAQERRRQIVPGARKDFSRPNDINDEYLEPIMRPPPPRPVHGRGASNNPANRFEALALEPDDNLPNDEEAPARTTKFYRDFTRSIIAHNDSPDVGFESSVNPYRGCEHGCIYCYARPTHEYLGFSAGLDFESRIMVKEDAPELLAAELSKSSWKPQVIAMSGVTDPYQPIERRLKLTRRCLEVFARFRNPVGIITKNALVARDIDLLGELAVHHAAAVNISVTSLDPKLQRILEPRTATPRARLDAIGQLRAAGIPVGVMVAPIIPGLTDHEAPAILQACAEAGAQWAGYTVVRLPFAVAPLFERWLEEHFPDRKEKILGRIRHLRGGEKLNDPQFKSRMVGEGIFAEQIRALFEAGCKRAGIGERVHLSTAAFRRPNEQLRLFG
ncbi:MAG TPA: PA0069 family radical SAM protein [Chthoniobacterales bacterium]|nr:PA0069 family radical SAM protein [Chthoniobacterales bacterium]